MRLALSLSASITVIAIAILAAGCARQQDQKPAPTATQLVAAVPTATPQPTPPPPAPSPTRARAAQSAAPPRRLEIPSVGVNASFEDLGLTSSGALDVPKNPDDLGWYKMGPEPGEKGNALVDGHVDWAGKIRAFWYLDKLKPGDSIIITDSNGNKHEFGVQWSKWYDANASVKDLFAPSDQAELTLITCGGQFDHTSHQYLSRLAVRARLK